MASICAGRLPPVFDASRHAAAAGLRIESSDLGDWSTFGLIAEYDGPQRTIRINIRAIDAYRQSCGALSSCDVRTFIDFAVAHELYHHCEAAGEVARLASRAEREAAADAFARSRVAVDARLAAFLAAHAGRARAASP
jgi:hypothetical protein